LAAFERRQFADGSEHVQGALISLFIGNVVNRNKSRTRAARASEKASRPGRAARVVSAESIDRNARSETAAGPAFGAKDRLFAAALVAAVFLVYQPVWRGGMLWDDDSHVTRPSLRSWQGLGQIWFEYRATLQYYPLVHSAFWIEQKLFGEATLGYHLVNIALHAASALMVVLVLRRLAVPGAWLAAALFALHPLQVETVAWITELKNTLSTALYLAAALAYLRFDRTRTLLWYLSALVLFVAALLTKTVTGTLPGALLVVLWWQRGRLSWKTDVLPLVPWFVLGAVLGMNTARWELEVNNCVGPAFQFTWIERLLMASRAAWFYFGKFFWPANLTFFYPRWQIDSGAAWQYLFPLAAAGLLAAAWAARRFARGPLAAALFFGGTLVPVLGFFNLYTFNFSFVADHYQYVACLGIIALVSAGIALLLGRAQGGTRIAGQAGCAALLSLLAVLSWRQCRCYVDEETLLRTTLQRNPDCWLAENNLGIILAGRGETEEAIAHYERALQIKPDSEMAHNNLGLILAGRGELDEAIAHYRTALEINPSAEMHHNLGIALGRRRQLNEAIEQYCKAIEMRPLFAEARTSLGNALDSQGKTDEAIVQYRASLRIMPDYEPALSSLAFDLERGGQTDEIIALYEKALELRPDDAKLHRGLACALAQRQQAEEAVGEFRKAIAIDPANSEARYDFAIVLAGLGQSDEAIAQCEKALAARPNFLEAHFNLGMLLASQKKFTAALEHYRTALRLASDRKDATALVEAIRKQIELAESAHPDANSP
jgi:tetratricopeptide (TPR) repeat protein